EGHWERNYLVYLAELMKKRRKLEVKMLHPLLQDYALESTARILNMVLTKKDFILQKESGRIVELEDEDILPSENTSEHPIEKESLALIVSQEEGVIPVHRSLVAMNAEIQSMYDNKVWRLVVLPPNAKVVKSKWIYKKKTDMDGKVHIYKARLVAKGCTQTYGVDYKETFSPVADIRAIRILIAIAGDEAYVECSLCFGCRIHYTAVKNSLKYLRNTKDTFLVYGGDPEAELRVNCYCDAGFETDRDDTES
nr:putative retrotransposon Ty1-copia subclass protein [Tanacetum cinerariifolium]